MNCLIVDDELLAQDVLEHYVSKIDSLTLIGKCRNAIEAFSALNRSDIDLIFLDIKMPEINGLDFIKALKNPPRIILTTAFSEYALDGYDLDVVDYLLKPVSFERFLKAVNKVQQSMAEPSSERINAMPADDGFFVKSDRKLIKINPSDILYIESQKNYLVIYTLHQKVMTYSTLNNMESELKSYSHLIRIHKSFMVNKNFITQLDNNIVLLQNNVSIPLGASYRELFLEHMRII